MKSKMKYTKQQVLDEKISFKPMTRGQYEKLKMHFGYGCPEYDGTDYSRFYQHEGTSWGFMQYSYLKVCDNNTIKPSKEISFEEFDFEEDFVLPEFWHVIITKENLELVSKWKAVNLENYIGGVAGVCSEFPGSRSHNHTMSSDWGYSTEITFEQFKQYVLKEEEMNNEKKIIGYRLIKPKYEEAVMRIVGCLFSLDIFCRVGGDDKCQATQKLREAGVLDLWFEPVYAEIEQLFDFGTFSVKIKDGKVYHKTDDITDFVKEMVNFSLEIMKFKPKIHTANIENVIFSRTGCQRSTTTLSQWLEVAKLANLV